MTEYEIQLLEVLDKIKLEISRLADETHDVGKDILLVRDAIASQTQVIHEKE